MDALKILYIEDKLSDFLLVERHLKKNGLVAECRRVDNQEELQAALHDHPWDLVLSDFNVPTLPFEETLRLLRPRLEDLPLILVSGSVGEERAVELLKQGVWDFVLKDNLTRLTPAITRNLRDIADRRARTAAEAALRDSEEQFRAMFELASIGMAQADPHTGQLQRVNRKLCDITGYSPAELQQLTVRDITHPQDRDLDWDLFQRVVRGETANYHIEKRYVRKDQQLVWVNVNMALIRDAAGQPMRTVATIEDITARRLAEEERRRLSAALDQAAESIVITDLNADILYVNPAFERITGYSRQEVIGRNPRLLNSRQHGPDFYRRLWSTLVRGEVWHGHFVNRRKDGTLFEEDATISPVRDAAGTIVNYIAIKLDVTREMALENQYRQSQKLEGIGQLAGGVAHDFNNILTSILMQVELASLEPGLPRGVRDGLGQIRKDADRAAGLTRQLLLFGRRQVMQSHDLDLNEIVINLAKMLQRIIGEDVHLQLNLPPAPLLTHADPGMLEQVAMNLAVNARDAMPNGGRLLLRTSEKIVDDTSPPEHPDAHPGRYVCLSVTDTGCGIPPEVLPRIFEPFFTTKEAGKGTGLGLATVFGIVRQHHGWLMVETELRKGTTFKVFLPASTAAAATPVAPVAPAPQPRGSEVILLVEDDRAVRQSAATILKHQGYQVLEASSGIEALRVWTGHRDEIDLLFTDLVMPDGLGGRELAEQLLADKPTLKIIFASGYSGEIAGQETQLRSGRNFLQKPYRPEELLKIIRRSLD